MGNAYPEISQRADYISLVIKGEEERFLKTLDQGVDLFERLASDVIGKNEKIISGDDAFKLYDTYGFPVDLTRIMSEEKGLSVDMGGFEKAMEIQRTRAREASSFTSASDDSSEWINISGATTGGSVFTGYENDSDTAKVFKYRICGNETIEIVFDKTPFYALSGGQASDTGTVSFDENKLVLDIKDVYDRIGVGRVHVCDISGKKIDTGIIEKSEALLSIDKAKRQNTERNHTSTHLLQAALQKVLGEHVRQSGSAVDNERLRFDFNHFSALSQEEISLVEKMVNSAVIENMPVTVISTTLEEARKMGAMSLFDEKYGESVRLVTAGDFSKELCGGTHVNSTGRIGLFKIVSESSVAAGIRRIEAITGLNAYDKASWEHSIISNLSHKLNVSPEQIPERVETFGEKIKELEKEIRRIKTQGVTSDGAGLYEKAAEIKGIKTAYGVISASDTDEIKTVADNIRDRLKSGAVILGSVINEKVVIVATVTDDIVKSRSLKAGDIVRKIAEKVGGSGGGKPNFAMAGGKDAEKLESAISSIPDVIGGLIN